MFSIIKFFAGFNIFNGEKLAKLFFYFILIAFAIGIYHKLFIAPNYRTNSKIIIEQPREVHNHYEQITPQKKDTFIGLTLGNLGLGLKYEK